MCLTIGCTAQQLLHVCTYFLRYSMLSSEKNVTYPIVTLKNCNGKGNTKGYSCHCLASLHMKNGPWTDSFFYKVNFKELIIGHTTHLSYITIKINKDGWHFATFPHWPNPRYGVGHLAVVTSLASIKWWSRNGAAASSSGPNGHKPDCERCSEVNHDFPLNLLW